MLIRAQTSPRSVKSKSISSELCEAFLSSAAVRDFLFIFAHQSSRRELFTPARAAERIKLSTDYGALCGCCVHNAFIRNRLLLFHFRLRAKRISLRLYIIVIIILRPVEKSDSADKLRRLNSHRFNMYRGIPLSMWAFAAAAAAQIQTDSRQMVLFFPQRAPKATCSRFSSYLSAGCRTKLVLLFWKVLRPISCPPPPSHHRTLLILFPDNL